MQRRIFASGAAILLVILALLLPQSVLPVPAALGQIRIPAEALPNEGDIQQVLEQGREFEAGRRWGDALTHYEEALRSHPGRRDLEQRLTLAKIHFDLTRRYADSSFTGTLASTSQRRALDLYSELLLKIDSHYVNLPNWRQIVHRGTAGLEVALTEPAFRRRNLPDVPTARIIVLRDQLRRNIDQLMVRDRHEARDAVVRAAQLAQQQLGIPPAAVVFEYICGATGALDAYCTYLTGNQLDDVYAQIEGNFVGLGIELKSEGGSLLIVNVITSSPAERGGVRAGDRIVQVDDHSTSDVSTDTAAELLKGAQGTTVHLTVLSQAGEARRVVLRREHVEVSSVENVKIIDAELGIGYVRLTSFPKTTSRDLEGSLRRLHEQGMKSLIIDVRVNPGGLLDASVAAADKFLAEGTIVFTRGRSPREDFDYKAHRVGTWGMPLFVLIDQDSASASDIFAGAIRDHRRGVVIGQRSYGKGSVQGIFPLSLGQAGVRLTTAKFYLPSGQPISHRGVHPDLVVRVAAKPAIDEPVDRQDDPVLAAAVQAAREQLAKR